MNENEKKSAEPTADELLETAMAEIADQAEDEINEIYSAKHEEDSDEDPDEDSDEDSDKDTDEDSDKDTDEDTDEDSEEDSDEDTNTDDEQEPAGADDSSAAPETAEPVKTENKVLAQVRKTLENLGVKVDTDEEIIEELQKIAAESKGVSLDKYKAELQKEEAEAQAREAIYTRDLDAIHAAFPSTAQYKHIREIPNAGRFFKLMATGELNATEAFRAANPDLATEAIVKSVKRTSLNGTKSHMTSSVPKQSGTGEISTTEMKEYRELFPELTDKQIMKLYKSTKN